MSPDFKTVADRIKDARVKKNLCQDYIAKSLGVSQKAYSKIENNETRLTIDTLISISKILEIPVVNFFCENQSNVLCRLGSRSAGDKVIHKTENETETERDDLYQQLIKAKDEIILSKEREIQTLLTFINTRATKSIS
jgi:transcriptional regulator with XRE-family HTH domain